VTSPLSRGISIYKQEGVKALSVRTLRKIHRNIYPKLMTVRGHYSLTLNDCSVNFSAPTATMVDRNCGRFRSEKQEIQDLIDEIREDDIVYDIGANTGLYTLFAAMACPNGLIVAFEPYPPNLNLLKRDIARNGLENVAVRNVALSDSIGTTNFSQPDKDDIGYGSSSIQTDQSDSTVEVPVTTGDQLVANGEVAAPNIIKIDVEGAEPLVLAGLEDLLSEPDCRTVYCEVHLPGEEKRPSVEDFGSSPESLRERLEEFGFGVEYAHDRGSEIFYKFKK
jgi:FkbM family methyltransferase